VFAALLPTDPRCFSRCLLARARSKRFGLEAARTQLQAVSAWAFVRVCVNRMDAVSRAKHRAREPQTSAEVEVSRALLGEAYKRWTGGVSELVSE